MKNKVYPCRCVAWKLSRRMRSVIAGFLLPGILCGVLGCGGSGTARVKGHVTLDGQPLQQGAITFVSVDGVARTVGTVVLDGQFIVDMPTGKKLFAFREQKLLVREELTKAMPIARWWTSLKMWCPRNTIQRLNSSLTQNPAPIKRCLLSQVDNHESEISIVRQSSSACFSEQKI